jgi:hypothetical protein
MIGRLINALERTWKDAVTINLRRSMKISVRMAGARMDMCTRDLQNKKQNLPQRSGLSIEINHVKSSINDIRVNFMTLVLQL